MVYDAISDTNFKIFPFKVSGGLFALQVTKNAHCQTKNIFFQEFLVGWSERQLYAKELLT